VGLINRIELASDAVSLAQGQIPTGAILRLFPIFFHRKKGMSKAQIKKLMMRRRRMFVDTVIMAHKRIHDDNREKIIEKTKAKITSRLKDANKPDSHTSKLSAPNKGDNKWKEKVKPKQGTQRTRIKGLVDNERERSRSKWATRVRTDSGSQREI
jgi:hypothetical protein